MGKPKSSEIQATWQDKQQFAEDAKLFEGVGFLVEATDYEQLTLWRDYYDRPKYEDARVNSWIQDTRGHIRTLGTVVGRPVCVSIFYATLNGVRVAFYEATSQIVDHVMIEQWLRKHTEKTIRCDNGHRWAHTNSMNFHHCLHEVLRDRS